MYQTAPYFVHDIQPTATQLRIVLTNYGLMKRNNKSILHPYNFWLCGFMTSTRKYKYPVYSQHKGDGPGGLS